MVQCKILSFARSCLVIGGHKTQLFVVLKSDTEVASKSMSSIEIFDVNPLKIGWG
jgi:hypothetical protein